MVLDFHFLPLINKTRKSKKWQCNPCLWAKGQLRYYSRFLVLRIIIFLMDKNNIQLMELY